MKKPPIAALYRTPDPATARVLEAAKAWKDTPEWDTKFEAVVRELEEAVEALAARERA